jgi:pathogenesis-related protein 1
MLLRTALLAFAILLVTALFAPPPSAATPPGSGQAAAAPSQAPPRTQAPPPAPFPAAPPVVKPVIGPAAEPPPEALGLHEAHKEYRTRHCAHWLRWSAEIADAAQARADELAKSCRLRPGKTPYGENLWAGTAGSYTPRKVVDSWYAEGRRYNYKRPGYSSRTARFTQLVWAASRRYGCATSTCKRKQFWVCLYDPPGNVDKEFARNVHSPKECQE